MSDIRSEYAALITHDRYAAERSFVKIEFLDSSIEIEMTAEVLSNIERDAQIHGRTVSFCVREPGQRRYVTDLADAKGGASGYVDPNPKQLGGKIQHFPPLP